MQADALIHLNDLYIRVDDYLISKTEGHDDESKTEISKCKRSNEPVLDRVEGVLGGDGNDDQHVTHHHDDHHEGGDDGEYDDLVLTVLTRVAEAHLRI